jgi:3-oxoacyl-[acyl-carrier-protein] synthase-1
MAMTSNYPLFLSSLGLVNALGRGKDCVAKGLFGGDTSGLVLEQGWIPDQVARVGRVSGDLSPLPAKFREDDCRNTRLLLTALEEIRNDVEDTIAHFGRDRIGVVLGTSTSGIEAGERAIAYHLEHKTLPPEFHYRQQEIGRIAPFLAEYLGVRGPAITTSSSCTSSGKALVTARNMIRLGLCDAVITGGSDSLCKLTLNGFTALESTSHELCNPMSRNRKGINVGEGAVLFILRREPAEVQFMGAGESSDAHHISSPDPTGRGAVTVMRAALAEAGLTPEAFDGYLNLHATATLKNDEMESRAVDSVFPQGVCCSGTKPLTGHMLGAAAATELAFCWLVANPDWNPGGKLPPHRWDGEQDPALPRLNLIPSGVASGRPRVCLTNSFAFGGNNLSLVVGRP